MSRLNVLAVGLILLAMFIGLWIAGSHRASGTATATPAVVTGDKINSGPTSVTDAVSPAKGIVVPARFARLSFAASGIISQIPVREGDAIKTGDALAQLDSRDLLLQVQAAQDSVDVSKAMLTQAMVGPSPEQISAAEAEFKNAQAQYDRAVKGPNEDEKAILQANLDKAAAAVSAAQAAYDKVGGANNPEIGMTAQSLQLQQARQDYQIAKANYELKTRVDPSAVAAAEAAVGNARMALEAKKRGASPADVAVFDAKVRQAETALAQARAALAKATLTAPFDGTVTNISQHAGEMTTVGMPVLTVADLSQLEVETTDLDEWGAARVKVGQAAKVTLNAFTTKSLSGHVVNIASQYVTLANGSNSYVVTVQLDRPDPDVRWGMTAKVEFQK